MSKANVPFPHLQELIDTQKGSTISKVLVDSQFDQAIRTNYSELKAYLSKFIIRLFVIAFNDDYESMTLTAFKVLTLGQTYIIPGLIKSHYFPYYAMKTLQDAEETPISDLKISRLCDITASILLSHQFHIFSEYPYVLKLLKYVYNQSVYDLFRTIFTDTHESIQEYKDWLYSIGFIDELVKTLCYYVRIEQQSYSSSDSESFSCNDVSSYESSANEDRIVNLMKIVSLTIESDPEYRPKFMTSLFKETFLMKKASSFPSFIQQYYWTMINDIIDEKDINLLDNYSLKARKYIIEFALKSNVFYRTNSSISNSLKLILKFAKTQPNLVDNSLLDSISLLMFRFCNSSYFLNDVRSFFQKCYDIPEVNARCVNKFAPLLFAKADDTTHGLISYFSIAIIEDMMNHQCTKKFLKNVEGSSKFIKNVVVPKLKIKQRNYGGKVPLGCPPLVPSPSFGA